jgi:hypothetical protein
MDGLVDLHSAYLKKILASCLLWVNDRKTEQMRLALDKILMYVLEFRKICKHFFLDEVSTVL